MIHINGGVFIGNMSDCRIDRTCVHACKTCHQKTVGYVGSLNKTNPFYLSYQQKDNLYLNIVDSDRPLFYLDTFKIFFEFAKSHYGKMIIHCDQGTSRAPMLAMLWLAKESVIRNNSYECAYVDYCKLKNFTFLPNKGIKLFVQKYWKELMCLE